LLKIVCNILRYKLVITAKIVFTPKHDEHARKTPVTAANLMSTPLPPQLKLHGALALALFEAAHQTALVAIRAGKAISRPKQQGCTVRPGEQTPLWNELVRHAIPHLHKRGAKTNLARLLGVPRQRIHDYLKQTTAAPDAERTLLLLCWVAARADGHDLLP